jgi:hypothetical protein
MEDDLAELKVPSGKPVLPPIAIQPVTPKPSIAPVPQAPAAPTATPDSAQTTITGPSLEEIFGTKKPFQTNVSSSHAAVTSYTLKSTPENPSQNTPPKAPLPPASPIRQQKVASIDPQNWAAEPSTAPSTPSFVPPAWIIKVGVGIFTVLFLSGGVWYWKQSDSIIPPDPEEEIVPTPAPIPTPVPPTPVDPTPPTPTFNLQGVNDLNASPATSSPDAFRALLLDTSQKMKSANIRQPLEFRILDENKTPLSFTAWSTWMKISLPTDILTSFDTSFSLFLYDDQGYTRLGLKVMSKNPIQSKTLLSKNESTLLKSFLPLYFNAAATDPKTPPVFKTGSYNGIATRYFNFATPIAPFETSLSLDYANVNQYIVFGTSKQTIRAVLDTINPIR